MAATRFISVTTSHTVSRFEMISIFVVLVLLVRCIVKRKSTVVAIILFLLFLPPPKEVMFPLLLVCLSVNKITQKVVAWLVGKTWVESIIFYSMIDVHGICLMVSSWDKNSQLHFAILRLIRM